MPERPRIPRSLTQVLHLPKRFGTFTGVFTPALVSILGVIMYVRLAWVVGNAGLLGAWLIMLIALGITACTGISLASIATNTRIGAGGPYAMISNSLGLEVGGSIGIPLYLSRPVGVAMYIFGFREGWLWLFPDHPPLLVDLAVFAVVYTLAYISTRLAVQLQYIIMAVIGLSLVSILASPTLWEPREAQPLLFGAYPGAPESGFKGTTFWGVFGIFFPAATGILAGTSMSGDLRDPRRNIPRGTLWAIAATSLIYFTLAWVATRVASPDELIRNYTIFLDRALFPPVVLAGLLGATFSSALAGAIGGPRMLTALSQSRILPGSGWLCRRDHGEPRNAIALTSLITLGALMMRDLNDVAPLVGMFFLIAYFVINLVLLIESSLGLVSFRPTLRVPRLIPLLGAGGCVFVMFVLNPTFSLIAVGTVIAIYAYILKRNIKSTVEDVRSGIFGALAEWAAARVAELGPTNVRAWKPSLLVPVEDPDEIRGKFRFLLDVCLPEGSIKLLGLATHTTPQHLRPRVDALNAALLDREVFATCTVIDTPSFTTGVMNGLQALQGAFFRPNILFLRMPESAARFAEFGDVIVQANDTGVGILLLALHPKAGIGQCGAINLWLRPASSGWDVQDAFRRNNLDLTLLMGYRLMRRWNAHLNLITVVPQAADVPAAQDFLREICDLARIPTRNTHRVVKIGSFLDAAAQGDAADLNILGLQEDPDFHFMQRMVEVTHASCLFVADSGRESALA